MPQVALLEIKNHFFKRSSSMAQVQRVKYLKTNLKDQSGVLLGIMEDLKSKKLTLKSMWGFSKQGGEAELVVIAKDTEKIKSVWTSSGMSVEEGTVFFCKGIDKAGALLNSLRSLTDAQVNIKALHAIALSGKFGSLVWVDPVDVEKAAQALSAK
jgi:hypothetical protein